MTAERFAWLREWSPDGGWGEWTYGPARVIGLAIRDGLRLGHRFRVQAQPGSPVAEYRRPGDEAGRQTAEVDGTAIEPLSSAPGELQVEVAALALEELAVAQALVMIHGRARGAERYKSVGGHVRIDEDGSVVVFWKGAWRLPRPEEVPA